MQYHGVLTKMQTEFTNPIQYYLVFENDFLNLNQLLGKKLKIQFAGYQCLSCNRDKKIFRQGFCYDCFYSTPAAGDWIMKPELSKAHLNIEDRDLAYEKKVQLQPHIVYLANSSNVKVGVTRKSQIPTRWIDQGAHEALEILEAPNRYLAGITEIALKEHVSDKTNWRKMLTNNVLDVDLVAIRDSLKEHIPQEAINYFIPTNNETTIHFPVMQYPTKLTTLNLEKTPQFEGVLKGIKGQYLLFENDVVFNVRSSEGVVVDISIG